MLLYHKIQLLYPAITGVGGWDDKFFGVIPAEDLQIVHYSYEKVIISDMSKIHLKLMKYPKYIIISNSRKFQFYNSVPGQANQREYIRSL